MSGIECDETQRMKRQRIDSTVEKPVITGPENRYNGFTVPYDGFAIERIDVSSITPLDFFERYVATRTPVVLKGYINDKEFHAPSKWTNEYLRSTAGDAILQVEERSTTTEKYGRGVEVEMSFKQMLTLMENGDDRHYLTTQDVEADEDGRPNIMAPFISLLKEDFPLRPTLMGHLIPQNINIWMGNNRDGSSTGLHHDYHDNLYIVLRGKKRFRLYSPIDTEKMYTRGTLVCVHSNGRINYKGEETTAYGADPMSESCALAEIEKEEAERELFLAEKAVEMGKPGAADRLNAAEERLDQAMLQILRVDRDEGDDVEEPEDDTEFGPFHFENEDECDDDDAEEIEDENERKQVDKTVKDPLNFSRIDTVLLKDPVTKKKLFETFPLFEHANSAFCDVKEGEMLYLPASWFHEVESFGTRDSTSNICATGHLALNYWYHPPDRLDAGDSFNNPYSSPFWPRDWAKRFEVEMRKKEK